MCLGVSLELAAAFFAQAGFSEHTIGLYARTPQLMEDLRRCANSFWDRIWWKETYSQRVARQAIGNFRYLHPSAVQAYMGFPFSEEALVALGTVPFMPERLKDYEQSGYVLVADPGLSIMQMKELAPKEFNGQQHHYEDWGCVQCKEVPAWRLIATKQFFQGDDFTWQDQQREEEGQLLLLSARRLVFGALALKLWQGTKHFWNSIVRTADVVDVQERSGPKRRRVTVGYDVHGVDTGISIDTWEDHVTHDRMGLGVEVNPKVSPLL